MVPGFVHKMKTRNLMNLEVVSCKTRLQCQFLMKCGYRWVMMNFVQNEKHEFSTNT